MTIIPPEYTQLEADGKRLVKLNVDVMINDGLTFYATARLELPVQLNFSTGFFVSDNAIREAVVAKYATLRRRKDVVIYPPTIVKPLNITTHAKERHRENSRTKMRFGNSIRRRNR